MVLILIPFQNREDLEVILNFYLVSEPRGRVDGHFRTDF